MSETQIPCGGYVSISLTVIVAVHHSMEPKANEQSCKGYKISLSQEI